MTSSNYPKRLIEVDLPIKRISEHARREKSVRHGHISTLHLWWARRPLASCRAVICASLWPDPADVNCPQAFRDDAVRLINQFARRAADDKEVAANCSHENWESWQRLANSGGLDATKKCDWNGLRCALLDFIADFANWDNSTSDTFLETSRALTQAAHQAFGGGAGSKPLVLDPFAGGGAIPLEALRVGADALASDFNPVAATINKVLLEYLSDLPEEMAGKFVAEAARIKASVWSDLAHFYKRESGTALAYIWARTIRCEGPGCGVEVPLLSSPWLSKHSGKYVWFQFSSSKTDGQVSYTIRGSSTVPKPLPVGTSRLGSATCPICGYTTPKKSVYRQLVAQQGGVQNARCMATIVASAGSGGREYMLPSSADLQDAEIARREFSKIKNDLPSAKINPISPGKFGSGVASPTRIGCVTFTDLFTPRQLLMLDAFSKKISEVNDPAIQSLLAFGLDRLTDYNSAHCRWAPTGEFIGNTFGRQAISIVWTYVEVNPFADASGSWDGAINWIAKVAEHVRNSKLKRGQAACSSATSIPLPDDSVDALVTDPPYYGAIMYGDLSDYFYVWLRQTVGKRFPDIFDKSLVEKADEIIATPTSKGPKGEAKDAAFFEARMRVALEQARRVVKPSGIAVVVFAHKSTSGWEAMLSALVSAGWIVTASWPIDTEREGRTNAQGTASLGSSVHLVCRPRESWVASDRMVNIGDWRDILQELPQRIHEWMPRLADEGVIGADAIFACLGPALEIFSRHSCVEKASGEEVTLREYLEYVWAAVAKEALNMIFEGGDATGFEEDARLTAMWLWTLSTGPNENGVVSSDDDGSEEDEESFTKKAKMSGFVLEFDAARKIAQGLGAHLEQLNTLVEIDGDKARLLPVSERARHLFGKDEGAPPTKRKGKPKQLSLLDVIGEADESDGDWGEKTGSRFGNTVLDRIHQCMILFAAGRGEALKRFLVTDGAGQDQRFWRLAQALAALYPKGTDERRWVEGVLARKKGLGF
jgi:putative DNA methylase